MDIAVSKVILHEDYDSWTIYNDICLLELSGEADFSSSVIGAISLPSDGKEYSAGTMCTVSGWGTTSEGGSLGQTLMKVSNMTNHLFQEVSYNVISRSLSLLSVMMTAVLLMVNLMSLTP